MNEHPVLRARYAGERPVCGARMTAPCGGRGYSTWRSPFVPAARRSSRMPQAHLPPYLPFEGWIMRRGGSTAIGLAGIVLALARCGGIGSETTGSQARVDSTPRPDAG